MFKIGVRYLSSARPLLNELPLSVRPVLAAKQFIPDDASRSKVRSLKRKEQRLKRQIIRDVNNLKKHSLENVQFEVDPVLGDPKNTFMQRVRQEMDDTTNLANGYEREDFEKLLYGAQKATFDKASNNNVLFDSAVDVESRKKRAVMTILNIKNTSAKDKRQFAIKRAVSEFQKEEGDTGSPEVQAAILTVKIHLGMDHVKQFPKDKVHTDRVRIMVQQRQRILKYLKRDRPQDYFYCIAKLGLTDDVITREFSMGRQYFQDYKVWGDKPLIKLSDKQKRKEQKYADLEKKVTSYNQLAKKNQELLDN